MYHDFVERYDVEDPEVVLEETIQQFQVDQDRRNEELQNFLDDFVASEEYEQYLEYKRNIIKVDVSVQYRLEDTEERDDEIGETVVDKTPLTTESRKMFAFIKQFNKYVDNKRNIDIFKKQQRGIKMIKDKIAELKTIYYCSRDKIAKQRENKEKEKLEEFCAAFNIDLSTLTFNVRNRIKDKVLYYNKITHTRKLKTKQNYIEIVRKITREYKRQREIDAMLNKTYTYKVHRRERIIKDMEVVGEQIILKPKYEYEECIEEEYMDEYEPEVEIVPKTSKKDQKEKKEKKGKDKKGGKDSKKSKASKVSKGGKKKDDELIIPLMPQCNIRKKIIAKDKEKLVDLINKFQQLEDVLENKHILAQDAASENLYDIDNNLLCTPRTLYYRNIECGKIYKKKVKILNISSQIQKFRLKKLIFPNEYDTLFFTIEPKIGIQKLVPGCYAEFTVIFIPVDNYKMLEGRILFISYDTKSLQYRRFYMDITCIPSYSYFNIYPSTINFGKIPVWRAQNTHFKTIKLQNDGKRPCTVVLKKIFDPPEMDPIMDDDPQEEACAEEQSYIKMLLKECVENVFNNFSFQDCYIKLDGFQKLNMNVKFKNVDHPGNYMEQYVADIYENNENNERECVGCQVVSLSAEITEHFIKTMPEVLDFEVCILNSVYQLSFDVYNDSSGTQTINVKFPSNMVDYVKSDVSVTYIPARAHRTIWIKFLPRKDILTDNLCYYDKLTSVLEFPIHVCVLSKTVPDVPPVRVTTFAVLTAERCLKLSPSKIEFSRYLEEAVNLDLGECTLYETVFTEIQLINNTLAPQIYGFTDIPECLTITPNYGFGDIFPNETRILRIHFSPDVKDIFSFFTEGPDMAEHRINFRITLETISNIGQTKKQFDYRRLRKSFEIIFKELKTPQNTQLVQDIMECAYNMKMKILNGEDPEEKAQSSYHDVCRYLDSYYGETEGGPPIDLGNQLSVTKMWLDAKIIVPLLELSHQYVEFPDTPCGSYATMIIELVALSKEFTLECDILKKNPKPKVLDYEASFKITGADEEIYIEPTCGIIHNGEFKKLTLIVKPKIPEEIILNTATKLKYIEVYERKKQEYELKKQKQLEKDAEKGKKDKKGGKKGDSDKKGKKDKQVEEPEKKKVEREPVITVTEKELQLNYLDLYPAEMFYWRSLQPYNIKTKFTCTINYNSETISRRPETLYLDASCTVIAPDFITDLKLQRIDFGKVAIGMKKVEDIVLQNISYKNIQPIFSLWNPFGPFSTPHIKSLNIPPEHFLQLPVVFEPSEESEVEEYFEIRSGRTILPLIFQGSGRTPKINIAPNFLVYRMDTKKKDIVECPFEIKNKGDCEITIIIEKMFEAQGLIKEKPQPVEEIAEKGENDKKGKKDKKADKQSKKEKTPTVQPFSNALTESEEYSFENFFTVTKDDAYFDTFSVEGDQIDIKPNGTKSTTICFGLPQVLVKKKAEFIKKLNDKTKGKGKGAKTQSSKSSKKSKGSSKGKKPFDNRTYYVTKYNIMLNKTFVKDVILICAFIGK